jgi:L-lactate dehydrogenase complex protein LldG
MVPGKPNEIMSKGDILNSIAKNKPAPTDLPTGPKVTIKEREDLVKAFVEKAEGAGSRIEHLGREAKLKAWIRQQEGNGTRVINLVRDPVEGSQLSLINVDPDRTDMVVIRGQMGVAENGAVWIDEGDMQVRNLPFVTTHLVLVLEKGKILPDMHEAYEQVDLDRSGFGVFIAGPSKTADIEQSLVIGAHGPIEHTILLY